MTESLSPDPYILIMTGAGLLKQVIASINVNGAHWGVLQLAYEDQG